MGKQSSFSMMAAEAFCHVVDERCMQSIDVSAFKNASITIGAVQEYPQVAVQKDLEQFIQPDSNTTRTV